jgi:hypothetical protein
LPWQKYVGDKLIKKILAFQEKKKSEKIDFG